MLSILNMRYKWTDSWKVKYVIQSGLVGREEIVEFDGIRREPCILLHFKDGFENQPIGTPSKRFSARDNLLCRNY